MPTQMKYVRRECLCLFYMNMNMKFRRIWAEGASSSSKLSFTVEGRSLPNTIFVCLSYRSGCFLRFGRRSKDGIAVRGKWLFASDSRWDTLVFVSFSVDSRIYKIRWLSRLRISHTFHFRRSSVISFRLNTSNCPQIISLNGQLDMANKQHDFSIFSGEKKIRWFVGSRVIRITYSRCSQ